VGQVRGLEEALSRRSRLHLTGCQNLSILMSMSEFDFHNLMDEAKEAFEKIGLYSMSARVGAVPAPGAEMEVMSEDVRIEDLLREGKADFFLIMTLQIGDVAFSDRILNPQSFQEKKVFEEIVPTELEMLRRQAAEEARSWEDGWDDED
jgi:hypothetical protein